MSMAIKEKLKQSGFNDPQIEILAPLLKEKDSDRSIANLRLENRLIKWITGSVVGGMIAFGMLMHTFLYTPLNDRMTSIETSLNDRITSIESSLNTRIDDLKEDVAENRDLLKTVLEKLDRLANQDR